MLIRRNTEGSHSFSENIDSSLGIFDMQGLLLNKDGHFTAAIEAFELPKGQHYTNLRADAFGNEEELYVRACFAEQVGVPFYVLLHAEDEKRIKVFEVYADVSTHKCGCRKQSFLTEHEFIEWWHKRKQTKQSKPYREQFLGRVSKSYFDTLLETNDLKWGGNVDGYFVTDSTSNYRVTGIIEKRFSTKTTITKYDPADYFHYGGGDYNTWKPLFTLKNILNVPLYLFTYSRAVGEDNLVGATILTKLTKDGITYIKDKSGKEIKPTSQICCNERELSERIAILFKIYSCTI